MIEVLEQALEALEEIHAGNMTPMAEEAWNKAITSLRQAIREHAMYEVQRLGQEIEQEPFAWFRYQQGSRVYYDTKKWDDCQPLYTQSASDYERGFIDGMQKQMQSSVDRAVNAMSQRTWVGLTDEERDAIEVVTLGLHGVPKFFATAIEAKLKEKNNA